MMMTYIICWWFKVIALQYSYDQTTEEQMNQLEYPM